MSVKVVEKVGDVKIFGNGFLGGKGEGLVKINERKIPKAHKLRTRVLTTVFYDRFLNRGREFKNEEIVTIASILDELGDIPISVRSSATNEACVLPDGGSVHAGENTSFMLPNNHPNSAARLNQLIQAIYYIYDDFIQKQPADSREKMAIVLNPIPGNLYHTYAGPVYYPLVSGVANSFFPYALKIQDPNEGFARIALGHGYAVVLDDFPVVSMATIRNPLPLKLLGNGQMYFYALDMTKNEGLSGNELETMKKLHIRFANIQNTKLLGKHKNWVTFERLIQDDTSGFKNDLLEIMEIISAKISSHYQIEFVFNLDANKPDVKNGTFHVVQLTQLPELKFETIQIPGHSAHTYLSINSLQGHGIKQGIKFAVVVSPFIYTKSMHDSVRRKISLINRQMHERDEEYIIIVPGRIGSNNKDWGIQIDYRDIDKSAAIFEYGVDIAGRAEPLPEKEENLTGGIYGSHFLYMIQGGYDEDHKRIQTRMYGTQGTHFLTNLVSNNVIFGYIAPGQDKIDPWFFTPADNDDALNVLQFPNEVTIYADSKNQHCVVI
ncbi:MAG: hypothetical protein GTO45_33970 [Candidatus Aminicenantes bacterium]|nr:hypothetical protein [Candidatus Aminicenantes bacterium]NIM83717.1 hypothetical protein [Candidatus Aminicenantes bacterium]NIN23142.1 hypothetical protein [Candidatus Aminicenantes bacterium]NIN46869.1 hypothetical protein [Candidatus Aminicenantes bacterium]NIN89791.1 hypothetical protein [Candidatus Aminicenantes bacterium]